MINSFIAILSLS